MTKFKEKEKVVLRANVKEGWPEELGVIIEVEDQNEHPGMYIVQVIETPLHMKQDNDGIREVHEDYLSKKTKRYETWKREVNVHLFSKCGITADEIPDWRYHDDYDNNVSPKKSAIRAIKNARDTFGLGI